MSPREEPAPAAGVPNLRDRQETTAAVLTRCQEMNELEDGYALSYPRSKPWPERLESFTTSWQRSCPHMTFEVVSRTEGPLVLHIRGPEGTKQFVEGARYMLTSHINPAPSLGFKARQAIRLATSPLRVLPDFLIVGAKKCGTTALYSYLTQHPSIAAAFKKEIYYFNAYHQRGALWYRSFFPTVFEKMGKAGFRTGEATPDYLFHPHTAQRIHDAIPKAKLIAILRNPVDRAYSFYNHNLRAGLETLSFEDAIASEDERLVEERPKVEANADYFSFAYMHHSYVTRGIYVDQLRDWTSRFGREQLLVLKTEDLYEQPAKVLQRAFEFLELDYHEPREFKKLNAFPYPDIDPATRAKLSEVFEPHNRRLYEFLGTDLGW